MSNDFNIYKFVSGLTVAGGICFGSYKYINSQQISISPNNKTFLVQAKTSDIKNLEDDYICLFGNEIDKNCQIISFNFTKQKFIDVKEVVSSSDKSKKIIGNSFYKLVLDLNKITSTIKNNETEITVKNKNNQATLKVISFIYANRTDEPVNFFGKLMLLVKADSGLFDKEIFNDWKCKTADNKHIFDNCKIYKFNDDDDSYKHSFNFSKIKKITKLNEIQTSSYYVVDLGVVDKKNVNDQNIKKILIFDGDQQKSSFSLITKIITNIIDNYSDESNNEAIILNTNLLSNPLKNTYIIAKSISTTQDGFLSGKNKNYVCKLDDTLDDNCSIIALNGEERTLEKITNSNINPEHLKDEEKYYKIFSDNEIVSKIESWNESEIINFVDKEDNEKIYGKLKPLFLIENGVTTKGKTDLIIAVINSVDSNLSSFIFENAVYTCALGKTQEEKICDVYKFHDPQPNLNNVFEHLKNRISKIQEAENFKNNNLLLINLKEQKFDISKTKGDEKEENLKINLLNEKQIIAELTIKISLINKSFNDGTLDSLIII